MKFTFTHMKGSRAGTTTELEAEVLSVGRDPQNHLAFDPVQDDKVSSFHATLAAQGGQVVVTDVGSRNGTFVNGHRISGPTPIVSGAVVQFGEGGPLCAIMYAPTGGAPPATPAAPGARGAPPPAAPPAAAAAAKAAAPARPDAPGPAPAAAKPGGKSRGCMVVGLIAGLLLACVVGMLGVFLREKIARAVPPGLMKYVQKIPVVNKIFKIPTGPRLPPGVRLPSGGGGRGGGDDTEAPPPPSTETTTEAPPASTETTTETTTETSSE